MFFARFLSSFARNGIEEKAGVGLSLSKTRCTSRVLKLFMLNNTNKYISLYQHCHFFSWFAVFLSKKRTSIRLVRDGPFQKSYFLFVRLFPTPSPLPEMLFSMFMFFSLFIIYRAGLLSKSIYLT